MTPSRAVNMPTKAVRQELLVSMALVANSSTKAVSRSGLLVLLVGNGPASTRLRLIQVNGAGASLCHSFNCWKLTGVTTRGENP